MRLAVFYRHAGFRRLSLGTLWHSASAQGEQVLVGLLVYELTGSTAWVGIAYALSFAPMLLVGLPAGLSADRYDRRRIGGTQVRHIQDIGQVGLAEAGSAGSPIWLPRGRRGTSEARR